MAVFAAPVAVVVCGPPVVSVRPSVLNVSLPADNIPLDGSATDDGLWLPLQVYWMYPLHGPGSSASPNVSA